MKMLLQMDVVLNFELGREILRFGEFMTAIKPEKLRERIEAKLKKAVEKYEVLSTSDEQHTNGNPEFLNL